MPLNTADDHRAMRGHQHPALPGAEIDRHGRRRTVRAHKGVNTGTHSRGTMVSMQHLHRRPAGAAGREYMTTSCAADHQVARAVTAPDRS